jgi:hypothetical protein
MTSDNIPNGFWGEFPLKKRWFCHLMNLNLSLMIFQHGFGV